MTPPRLLGMFAHPDDETFCAGGSLARYADEGCETMVVSATRGEAGQIRDATRATRRTLGAVRERELEAACAVLGVRHVRCLDYHDGTLADADGADLRAAALEVIAEFSPDVVITFGDDGAYGHPDHTAISQATTDAFLGATAELDRPPRRLYHSHFPRSRLLLRDRLARWLVELNARFKGRDDFGQALSLFAEETTTMRYASDYIDVNWFPPGVTIVEQGEPPSSLYLVLSGQVDVIQETGDGAQQWLARLGPGEFFGELAIAQGGVRTANVVAVDAVTCLVLSPSPPTAFAGRGTDARYLGSSLDPGDDGPVAVATTAIDVSAYVDRKVSALAAHRTQFPIDHAMFPESMLRDMFGTEYFVRVHPPVEPESDLLAGSA
ncbi:MAG TPA: PIG-L family deacetylase [Acidimicrobiales bacterium]|nr:PIG-L family deacetylase [Acidimicrobiales bacterium]